jgi:hypothetical protein
MEPHRVINVHQGSRSESWLTVYRDGRIKLHWENDGYVFLRHGPEAKDTWIFL